jgi:hypothetical protein
MLLSPAWLLLLLLLQLLLLLLLCRLLLLLLPEVRTPQLVISGSSLTSSPPVSLQFGPLAGANVIKLYTAVS